MKEKINYPREALNKFKKQYPLMTHTDGMIFLQGYEAGANDAMELVKDKLGL